MLVLKAEEPGSKQKLAVEYGYTESICHDTINHLVNDIIVMNAKPLTVLGTIVCGKAEKDTINSLMKGILEACKENQCTLIGGETSIQPQVMEKGVYVLTASIAGVADKKKIIDGRNISINHKVLAVVSNGLHTNGYSLVRLLMDMYPDLLGANVNDETFISAIMKPHIAYYPILKGILNNAWISGMAHITGGGIKGNLGRIIPDNLCAEIDLSLINVLQVFKLIKDIGKIHDEEMLSTFNCGVVLIIIAGDEVADRIKKHVNKYISCYEIGKIKNCTNGEKVEYINRLKWN